MVKKNTRKIPKPTSFGKNLRFLRRLRGISQQEIAHKVGLNRNNIASYESGSVEPNAEVFLKISDYLKVSPYLMLVAEMESEDLHKVIEVNHPDDIMNDYLKNHLSNFINATDQTNKIVEAYLDFYSLMHHSNNQSDCDHLKDQVIELVKELLANNWKFLQNLNITEEE